MIRAIRFGALALSALTLAGCSPARESSPLAASISGPAPTVYTGSVVDSINGNGTAKLSLVSVSGLLSGTWEMSFGGKADPTRYMSGPLNGISYTARVSDCPTTETTSCSPDCGFNFSGSLGGSTLAGNFASVPDVRCRIESGTISVTKQ